MAISSWLSWPNSRSHARRGQRPNPASRSKKARFSLEPLEGRALLTSYTAAGVSDLIADITAANTAGGANTITLTAATTAPYVLTAVNNTFNGANGLPVVDGNMTIVGAGDTIERSTAAGTPAFRLFAVSAGYTLTLQNLTLQGGLAFGSGVSAEGGAIYNQGNIFLGGVIVENNEALGVTLSAGGGAGLGGGLYQAGGTAILTDTTLSSNIAQGGNGTNYSSTPEEVAGGGGNGSGGALYIAAGEINLNSDNVASNIAQGGLGGQGGPNPRDPGEEVYALDAASGGPGIGGALCVHGYVSGSVTNSTLSNNIAQGGVGGAGVLTSGTAGPGGLGEGGAIQVTGSVSLNADTLFSNTAQGGAGGQGYHSVSGGAGIGGGVYVPGGGPYSLTSLTLTANTAQGGAAGVSLHNFDQSGGSGQGGAIYIGNDSEVTLRSDTLSSNIAQGGAGGSTGYDGQGEGLYIVSYYGADAVVSLDAFTVANVIGNTASRSYPNIFGTYTVE